MPRRPIPGKDAKKTELSRKSKREIIIIETNNSENNARLEIQNEAISEFNDLQKFYEVESRRTKDNYILTLERRFAGFRSQTQARMDMMENNFTSVLAAVSRMLTEAYTAGAATISRGATFSERLNSMSNMQPAGGKNSNSSANSTPPPSGTSTIVATVPLSGKNKQQKATSDDPSEDRIRKFFNNVTGTETKLETLNTSEMCGRLDELREAVVGLVSFSVKRLTASRQRIHQLESALSEQTTHLISSEKLLLGALAGNGGTPMRNKNSTSASRSPSAAPLRSVNGCGPQMSIHREAIELCRQLGQTVRDELDAQKVQLRQAIDTLLNDSMEISYQFPNPATNYSPSINKTNNGNNDEKPISNNNSRNAPSSASRNIPVHPLQDFYKQACADDFCTKIEGIRLRQAEILRLVRDRMTELESERLIIDTAESAKLLRTNIPEPQREILHSAVNAFDRDALLQLLDRLSFEPSIAETIIAVVNKYSEIAKQQPQLFLMSTDGSTGRVASAATTRLGAGSATPNAGGSPGYPLESSIGNVPLLARPPPPKSRDPSSASSRLNKNEESVNASQQPYTAALNAMAHDRPATAPKPVVPGGAVSISTLALVEKAKSRFAYPASPKPLTSEDKHDSNLSKASNSSTTPVVITPKPPSFSNSSPPPQYHNNSSKLDDSGLLPLDSSPLHYAAASHFPEVAGVSIPADYLLASPLSKHYVSSEGKRRMEAQRMFHQAKQNDENAMRGHEVHHTTPRERRQELISVLLEDGPEELEDNAGGPSSSVVHRGVAINGDVYAKTIATKLLKATQRLEAVKASSSSALSASTSVAAPVITTTTAKVSALPPSAKLYSEKLRALLTDFD